MASDSESEWTASESDCTSDSDDSMESSASGGSSENDADDLEGEVNRAPDGTLWTIDPPAACLRNRRNIRNVRREPPGPKSHASKSINTPKSAWELFLTPPLISAVHHHTFKRHKQFLQNHPHHWSKDMNITCQDIYSYCGIRYHIGKERCQRMDIKTLWNETYGEHLCKAAMSRSKFELIHTMLRFDDAETRQMRVATDRFAAVRDIHQEFAKSCSLHWTPATHVTIDEQILSFRGNCPIKVYDKSKPDTYGIKMYVITDSKTHYVLYVEPYVRGQLSSDGYFSGISIFKRLVDKANLPTGTGICADRFFVDYALVEWCQNRGFTVLGTVRNDKRCVPPSMRKEHLQGNPEGYSRTVFTENCSLAAFIPPRHAVRNFKAVLCLSSEHVNSHTDPVTGKPLSIVAYNEHKAGVDMLNWCCKEYTTKKKSRRWTMRVFEQMLDIAGYNAWVVFRDKYPDTFPSIKHGGRRLFLGALAKELSACGMADRAMNNEGLHQPQIHSLSTFGFNVIHQSVAQDVDMPRAVCHVCPASRKRKSKQVGCPMLCACIENTELFHSCLPFCLSVQKCSFCNRAVCGEHSKVTRLCHSCL